MKLTTGLIFSCLRGLAVLAVTVMLLTACSDDTPDTSAEVAEIHFRADAGQVMEGTRATTISSDTELQGHALRIDAYLNGTNAEYLSGKKLVYDTDTWRFDDGSGNAAHYYWPIAGSVYTASGNTVGSIDFVGYCPYDTPAYISSISYSAGHPSFVCNMSWASQNDATEFMWAYTGNQTQASNSGTVNMTFMHPFARIFLKLSPESSSGVSVNSVTISGVKSTGTCTFDGTTTTWTPSGDATNFVVSGVPASGSTPAVPATGDTPYLVIPQTFAANLTFTVNATWTDWSNVTKDISASVNVGEWQPGHSYTYTLTLNKEALIVETEKYTEQW